MANIIPEKTMDLSQTVLQMAEDARFDVSEGDVARLDYFQLPRKPNGLVGYDVPKVFLSNDCIFNCAYCGCRSSNERKRPYALAPRELAELSAIHAQRLGSGIFLSSAIFRRPDYTQELLIETMRILRREMGYGGYLHCKVMPGTDPALIRESGRYASRLSVNIEVARSEGYSLIARNKNKGNILTPMGNISSQIKEANAEKSRFAPAFANSQCTQLMAGSTGEDDQTILNLSGALYKKYGLSRVYYTAYTYQDPADGYGGLPAAATPVWRVKRLYQADRLMQLYGFSHEELAPPAAPNLKADLDPKAAWALRNLHRFPVEVNKAGFEELVRIPGIGVTGARRILEARRYCTVTHDVLRSLKISLKRSRHFLTCRGKYQGETCDDAQRLYRYLAEAPPGNLPGQMILGQPPHGSGPFSN